MRLVRLGHPVHPVQRGQSVQPEHKALLAQEGVYPVRQGQLGRLDQPDLPDLQAPAAWWDLQARQELQGRSGPVDNQERREHLVPQAQAVQPGRWEVVDHRDSLGQPGAVEALGLQEPRGVWEQQGQLARRVPQA